MRKSAVSIILVVLLIFYLVWLFIPINNPTYRLQTPFNRTTASFSQLKSLFTKRAEWIRKHSGSWTLDPYNSQKLTVIEQASQQSTNWNSWFALNNLTPNFYKGFYPLKPLSLQKNTISPAQISSVFQFEQGCIGWYWGYATFPTTLDSVMFYIIRLDVVNPEIRQKESSLQPAETAIYYLSFGVGHNQQWEYSPYTVVSGSYIADSLSKFQFTANDSSQHITVNLTYDSSSSASASSFSLQVVFGNSNGFQLNFSTSSPAHINGQPNGCAPCVAGNGTLYWSFTDLQVTGNITFRGNILEQKNVGVGWLDHQWAFSGIRQPFTKALVNTVDFVRKTQSQDNGLGRYIWLNLHLDGTQYMVYVDGIDSNLVIREGLQFPDAVYNKYTSSTVVLQQHNLAVLTIQKVSIPDTEGTIFPLVYKLDLKASSNQVATSYVLDSSPFGFCVTIDPSGNLHYSGSGLLYDQDHQTVLGTCFLEANQFQQPQVFLSHTLQQAGLALTDRNIKLFSNFQLRFSQVLPSLIVLIGLPLTILIFLIINLIRRPT